LADVPGLDHLHDDIGTTERLRLIADFPIEEMVCAPGHRSLRSPGAVEEIAERIRRGEIGDLLDEPILIGIFTIDRSGEVGLRCVECLDGHHRLLGGLLSGVWRSIGDIPRRGLDARVNGWPAHASGPEGRWIPLEVARASSLDAADWLEVPESWGAKGPTAQLPGGICGIDPVFPERFRGIPLRELVRRWTDPAGAALRA